jgi:hypothetical protein
MRRPAMWNSVFTEIVSETCHRSRRAASAGVLRLGHAPSLRMTETRAFALAQDDTPWILLALSNCRIRCL